MIPQNSYTMRTPKVGEKDYRFCGEHMGGLVGGVEALKGWIALALSTERYAYPIFSDHFGAEYDLNKRMSDEALSTAITDALTVDPRITRVFGFTITRKGGEISATFTVETVYGTFETTETIHV